MSATPSVPDFGRLAADYDRLRPADDNWLEIFELVVQEADLRGRRVLDCGCGTGRLSRALAERGLARVWGVDPEPQMLAVARRRVPKEVGLRLGRAEQLPFRDRWFERAVLWLVYHLLDRRAALPELRRVLGEDARLAVVTFDPDYFADFWLTRLFPSLERIDRERFPSGEELRVELESAGFAGIRLLRRTQHASISREEALDRIRNRHISTFDLLDEEELRVGTARAAAELPPTVEYAIEWLIVVACAA